jgi:hypothetical protein
MKKVIGMMLGALVCSLAATAFAAESTERLSRLGAGDGNIALLYTTDGVWDGNGISGCGSAPYSTLIIDLSTEGGREMYRTALAAYLAGQPVKAFYGTCHGGTGFPKASRIDIVAN